MPSRGDLEEGVNDVARYGDDDEEQKYPDVEQPTPDGSYLVANEKEQLNMQSPM